MKLKPLATGAAALTVLGLAACQSPMPSAPATPGACRPDAAQALAGKDRVSDDQARQLTGASLVRQIAPGQPVTLDYRQERVTIETDPKTGKVVRAFCG
ncbi:I78 family peptidase inhibitor [Hydrogenophaga borbori]|uniref:I78 family peptidase inhibitor n=1 Tax=Hydrogenophaga borbori TaxID=2294117 RepID=UPI00301E453F